MNSETVVFLDTSIQIERVIGNKTRQAQIEQELKNPARHFVTSSYIFMEFQRSLWADFVYIYNLMQQQTDWQTIAYRLRSGARSHRSRALGNCLQIFTWALVESHLDHERALDFVELQVTQSLPEDFWWHVTLLPDPIVCDLVQSGLRVQPDGQCAIAASCREETAACSLPDFLNHHRDRLHTLAAYLKAHPRSIKKQACVEHLLAAVMTESRAALGQAACWPLGDVIIALQVPANASLWTLDADFQPQAKALGLRLYTTTFL